MHFKRFGLLANDMPLTCSYRYIIYQHLTREMLKSHRSQENTSSLNEYNPNLKSFVNNIDLFAVPPLFAKILDDVKMEYTVSFSKISNMNQSHFIILNFLNL